MEQNKPISIILDDFKNSIAKIINESNLHPSLIEPIMKDLYNEISIIAKQQLEKDKQDWEFSQNNTIEKIEDVEVEE